MWPILQQTQTKNQTHIKQQKERSMVKTKRRAYWQSIGRFSSQVFPSLLFSSFLSFSFISFSLLFFSLLFFLCFYSRMSFLLSHVLKVPRISDSFITYLSKTASCLCVHVSCHLNNLWLILHETWAKLNGF